MGENMFIPYLSNTIYHIIIFISFLYLYSIRKYENITLGIKFLYVYPMITLLLGFLYFLCVLDVFKYDVYFRANFLSLYFHLIYLYFLIREELSNKKIINISKVIFVLFFTLLTTVQILYSDTFYLSIIVSYNGVLFFSLLYFVNVFINIPEKSIHSIPTFWIVLGILANSIIAIPTFSLFSFLKNKDFQLHTITGVVAMFGASIMYLSFIKGVLCLKKEYQ